MGITKNSKERRGNNNINIFHSNIRSIYRNYDLLIYELHNMRVDYDMILLTEAWLGKSDNWPDSINIEGYKLYGHTSKINKASGALMYIKEELIVKQEDIIIKGVDCCSIKISNLAGLGNLIVTVVYRTEEVNENEFIENLNVYLEEVMVKGNKVIIIGDINIDLLKNDNCVKSYLDCISMNGCNQLNNEITRPKMNNSVMNVEDCEGTNIDHVIVNIEEARIDNKVIKRRITDHYMLHCSIKLDEIRENYKSNNNVKRNYDQIKEDIDQSDLFEKIIEMIDPDQIYL